mmetsp:Transcript_1136/g.2462  ORF Transcript_1136/g.2462 Transcript_1136/m.2462 type:complete len:422 (+) Transcript_1136:375-1640(+)
MSWEERVVEGAVTVMAHTIIPAQVVCGVAFETSELHTLPPSVRSLCHGFAPEALPKGVGAGRPCRVVRVARDIEHTAVLRLLPTLLRREGDGSCLLRRQRREVEAMVRLRLAVGVVERAASERVGRELAAPRRRRRKTRASARRHAKARECKGEQGAVEVEDGSVVVVEDRLVGQVAVPQPSDGREKPSQHYSQAQCNRDEAEDEHGHRPSKRGHLTLADKDGEKQNQGLPHTRACLQKIAVSVAKGLQYCNGQGIDCVHEKESVRLGRKRGCKPDHHARDHFFNQVIHKVVLRQASSTKVPDKRVDHGEEGVGTARWSFPVATVGVRSDNRPQGLQLRRSAVSVCDQGFGASVQDHARLRYRDSGKVADASDAMVHQDDGERQQQEQQGHKKQEKHGGTTQLSTVARRRCTSALNDTLKR